MNSSWNIFCTSLFYLLCTITLFSLLYLFQRSAAVAANCNCEQTPLVDIVASDDSLNRDICNGADKALVFLSRYNLHLKRSVSIEIVDETELFFISPIFSSLANYNFISATIFCFIQSIISQLKQQLFTLHIISREGGTAYTHGKLNILSAF